MTQLYARVQQDSVAATANGQWADVEATSRGELIVIDFYAQMVNEGRGFQLNIGTLTTPTVGDVVITNSAAEMCADAQLGMTVIPTQYDMSVNLGTGTLHEYAIKSAAAPSTAGTAFVPLPLITGGTAATTTARVAAAGAVSVPAELATTTRRHWSYSNPVAVAAGHSPGNITWQPLRPPVIVGSSTGSCIYVQVAAATTGPSYFASLDYIELATASIV